MNILKIKFLFKNIGIKTEELKNIFAQLIPEITRVKEARQKKYETKYAVIHSVYDQSVITEVQQVTYEKKKLEPKALFVLGIGGSCWGAKAIVHALYGMYYNEINSKIKIYFIDSVDTDYVDQIYAIAKKYLDSGVHILVAAMSKSGTTTETIANMYLFESLLQKYEKENMHKYMLVVTDKDSPLWIYGQKNRYTVLEIPKNIGGRYSVFTPVGLFVCAMFDISIEQLCAGAADIVDACISDDEVQNYAALSAIVLVHNYRLGMYIHDTFIFSPDCEYIGQWYRQLLAESIGKKYDTSGNEVAVGITPVVSVGSRDLHSVAQLYLSGPNNFMTTFISIAKPEHELLVPKNENGLVANISGKKFATIQDAILHGTMDAYEKAERMYMSIILPEKNAYFIGQLLMCKMIEVIYIGFLLNINPFDQPQVELYKFKTRELLAK